MAAAVPLLGLGGQRRAHVVEGVAVGQPGHRGPAAPLEAIEQIDAAADVADAQHLRIPAVLGRQIGDLGGQAVRIDAPQADAAVRAHGVGIDQGTARVGDRLADLEPALLLGAIERPRYQRAPDAAHAARCADTGSRPAGRQERAHARDCLPAARAPGDPGPRSRPAHRRGMDPRADGRGPRRACHAGSRRCRRSARRERWRRVRRRPSAPSGPGRAIPRSCGGAEQGQSPRGVSTRGVASPTSFVRANMARPMAASGASVQSGAKGGRSLSPRAFIA